MTNEDTTGDTALLRRDAAAEYLGLATQTLDNWRSIGRGPRYCKFGSRILYPLTELVAFKQANLRGPGRGAA